ncbi:MAG: ectoine hydroxylase [Candidatus Hydrogenedentes bacterium]|nr:ectoine hydroxylase [Candidatus Hydrogenedentota bacterium]
MTVSNDTYPSRVEHDAQILPRTDPVVYGTSGPLTPTQLAEYDANGYCFLESFLSEEEVTVLRLELESLRTAERVRQSEISITEPASGAIRSIFAVQTVSDAFASLAADQRILGMVRQILGSDVYIHQSRLNLKPGFVGKEFYWHSDFETWHAEDGMPAMRAVSCSVALTDNHEFNGPLMLMPGSHRHFVQCAGRTPEDHFLTSLKKQEYGVPSCEQLEWLTAQCGIAVPKGPAGSIILFDCNVMHGSNSNITPYPRSNAFFVYNSIENTLEEPFSANGQRPWYLASRAPEVITPKDFRSTCGNLMRTPQYA